MRTPKRFDTKNGPRWRVRYRRDGRQTTQTFDTQAEADKFCIDLDAYGAATAEQMLYDRLAAIEVTTPTLDEWVATWLDDICDANAATRDKYRRMYARHISPMFGTLPIERITEDDCRRLVRALGETKQLKDATVSNVFSVLSGALGSAHKRGIIAVNPSAETKIPTRTAHLDEEATFLTRVEFLALRAAFDPRFVPLLDFVAGTGARWGECAALQVRDLDLRGRYRVRINKAVKQDGRVGPPKSRRSVRLVSLPPETVASLLSVIAGKSPGDLVFTMPRGGQLHHRSFVTRYWIKACETAGLTDPRPTFHSLRHSHASWLLQDGVDIFEVSRRLGHASTDVTTSVYGHLDPNAHERQEQIAASVFGGILAPARELSE